MDTMQLQQKAASMKMSDWIAAAFVAVIVLGGGGWGLTILLPILVELAKNTIIFFLELLLLVSLVVFTATNLTNMYYFWRNLSRKIRKAIVADDPIGILETVIHRFARKLEQIDENITVAIGAKKRIDDSITRDVGQSDRERSLAESARRMKRSESEVAQHATASDRWKKAGDDLRPMQTTLTSVQTCLERARDLCSSRLDDLKNQKQVLQSKLEALQSGQKAVQRLKRFFGNNPDLDMQDMAIDEIERQSSEAMAEIEQFMRVTNPMLEAADLEKSADQMRAMEKFNAYISGGGSSRLLTGGSTSDRIELPVKEGVLVGDKASRYLNMGDK